MASTEPKLLLEIEDGLLPGTLNKEYIASLKSKKLKEIAHQKNRRTDFKVIHIDFKDWMEKNPNLGDNEKSIQRAIIDQKGKVIPTDSNGNFIQQLN